MPIKCTTRACVAGITEFCEEEEDGWQEYQSKHDLVNLAFVGCDENTAFTIW